MAKKYRSLDYQALMKKKIPIVEEFKKFILRGSVIDLAVGVIVGGAFNKIVNSLVNDLLMPIFSIVLGKVSLDGRFIALDGKHYATLEEAGTAPLLKYGSFLSTVLEFLIMGVAIFMLVKSINFLQDKMTKTHEEAAPATKACPFCLSDIHVGAKVCPHCTRELEGA